MEPKAYFWTTLPGILAGLAAVLSAAGGLFLAVRGGTAAPVTLVTPPPATTAVAPPVSAAPLPATAAEGYPRTGEIDDPDGFVNVRAGPGVKQATVATIHTGERFGVAPDDGSWWRVRTGGGVEGYVHRSRIRLGSR